MWVFFIAYKKYIFIDSVVFIFYMKLQNIILSVGATILLCSCNSNMMIKNVVIPTTPVDTTKMTKKAEKCHEVAFFDTTGYDSVIETAKIANIKNIRLIEQGEQYEIGGLKRLKCTYVYGD